MEGIQQRHQLLDLHQTNSSQQIKKSATTIIWQVNIDAQLKKHAP